MTELKRAFDTYQGKEIEKFKELSDSIQSPDDLAGLSLRDLYPEFRLGENDAVGVFDPFTTGENFGLLIRGVVSRTIS